MSSLICLLFSWFLISGATLDGQSAFNANTSFAPLLGAAAIFNSSCAQTWLIGGARDNNINTVTNQVWTSYDMVLWSRIDTSATMFAPRSHAAATMDANETMYLCTGYSSTTFVRLRDVWTSRDGIAWTSVCAAAPFLARSGAQLAIYTSAILSTDILTLVGGYGDHTYLSDVWASADGGTVWLPITMTSSFAARDAMIMVTTSANAFVLAQGTDGDNPFDDAWVSFDGAVNWYQCSAGMPTVSRWWPSGLLDIDEHLIIAAGETKTPAVGDLNDNWRSTMSFSDTLSLARTCIGKSSVFLPVHPGLQCWPPNSTCHINGTNVTYSVPQFDSVGTTSNDTLILYPPNLPFSELSATYNAPIRLSSSGSVVCILRQDHSIVCTDPLRDVVLLSLADYCPWSINTTYQCGTGRAGVDGNGWIGSAYGDVTVSNATAAGFSYISITAVNLSAVGLFLLTSVEQHPTYYGTTSLQWNYSLNAIQYTDRYCLSPVIVDMTTQVDPMRLIPIRRHTRLPSLLHTTMQSVCGDNSKACGLTMNGTVLCWHSDANDEAPITVSPPAYMTFTQLSCGIDPEVTSMSYACAIIANVGMAGRIICWNVSGSIGEMLYLDNITYWMYAEMFHSLDIVLQRQLGDEWSRDLSISGQSQCNAFPPQQPFPALMNYTSYMKTPEYSVVRQLTKELVFRSITCVHWSESCALITTDDILVRTNHSFEPASFTKLNMTSKDDISLQTVALANSIFTSTISARMNIEQDVYVVVDESFTSSITGSWSSLFKDKDFSDVFDDLANGVLCGVQQFLLNGKVICSKPLPEPLRLITKLPLRQVKLGVFGLSNELSPTSGLCGQRMNDSDWQCFPSLSRSFHANAIVPISTGIPRALTVVTAQAPWSSRYQSVTQIYPHSLTFNNQSNGAVIVLQPNSIVIMTDDRFNYKTTSPPNDVWASGDGGKT